jgi:hypothetical protein
MQLFAQPFNLLKYQFHDSAYLIYLVQPKNLVLYMWVGMQYAKVRSKIKSNQVRMSAFINKGAMLAQKSPNSSTTKNYSRK